VTAQAFAVASNRVSDAADRLRAAVREEAEAEAEAVANMVTILSVALSGRWLYIPLWDD
jgi:hypothetical protein